RDPLQRAHLASEPLPGLDVTDDVRPEHLQGDPAPVRPLREVHDTHAALADGGEQPVGTDARLLGRLAGRRGHRATVAGALWTSRRARCAWLDRASADPVHPAEGVL